MEKICSNKLTLVVVLLVMASCQSAYLSFYQSILTFVSLFIYLFCLISYGCLINFILQSRHSLSFQEPKPIIYYQFLARMMLTVKEIAQTRKGFVASPAPILKSVHGQRAFVLVTKIKEFQESLSRCAITLFLSARIHHNILYPSCSIK